MPLDDPERESKDYGGDARLRSGSLAARVEEMVNEIAVWTRLAFSGRYQPR